MLFYLVLLLVLLGQCNGDCGLYGNAYTNDSEIFLKGGIGDLDYAREEKYKKIYCCAHNFYKMIWDFKQNGDIKWQPFPWYPMDYPDGLWLDETNQTLSIKRVQQKHGGMYRCRAFNESNEMIAAHTTKVIVYSCKDRVKPEAYGPQNQYASTGQAATFTCSGDFGCTSDALQDVSWYDANWNPLNDDESYPRYNVSIIKRNKETYIQSTFTIHSVTESDFGQNFTCYVTSAYRDGNRMFIVQLRKSNIEKKDSIVLANVIGPGVFCFVVFLLAVIVIAMFYHPIKLFIFSRLPFGSLEGKGDKKYHVFILLEDQDVRIAENIKKQLEADSYKVKTSESILGNEDIMQSVPEYAQKSKSLIIVHPTKFERNPNNNFERLCGIRKYFEQNLVTVIKEKKSLDSVVDTLTDKTLVSLVIPSHKHGGCAPFSEKTFYSKLKLRLPNPRKKHRSRPKETGSTRKLNDEEANLMVTESMLSPIND